MELYFKDLISPEVSLEQLVDDLMRVVQGADEFVQATGAHLPPAQKQEITIRLKRLREACGRVKRGMKAGVAAADNAVHEYPYSSIGVAFGLGLLAGALFGRGAGD